jgi:hypothetical protein
MSKFLNKHYKPIITVILLFMATVSFLNAWNDSATFDEKAHIPSGYSYMKLHDMRLNPEHPPLIKDLSGLPLLFVPGIKFDTTESFWAQELNETAQWNAGNQLLWNSGNNADQIIFWSRVPIVILSLILGLFIFKWVKELTGRNNLAGLFALTLYAFNPNILGHNHFVTTDIGIAAFSVFSFYYFLRFIKDPTWKNTTIGGIFLGLVLLAKFSAVLLFPIYALVIVAYPFLKPKRNSDENTVHFKIRKFFTYIGKGLVAGAVAMLVVYVVYAFNTYEMPKEKLGELINFYFPANDGSKNAASLTAANNLFSAFNKSDLGKPMAEYMMGVGMVFKRVAGGNGAYFMSEVSGKAFPLYFPVVYLIKEPLSSLFFLLLAIIIAIYTQSLSLISGLKMDEKVRLFRDYLRRHISELSMLGFIILYWYVSLTGNLNIGFRHLFPAIPFMMILVSVAIFRFWENVQSRQNKIIFGLILSIFSILLISNTVATYPYYLSYFNPVAGGPKNGFQYVTDSNADWGQDMKRLKTWIKKYNNCSISRSPEACVQYKFPIKYNQSIEKIRVNYFGAADPKYYLGRDVFIDWWDSKRPIEPGWYAVSTNAMMGSLYDKTKKTEESYQWLRNLEPVAQVGTSIFIYYVTPEQASSLKSQEADECQF